MAIRADEIGIGRDCILEAEFRCVRVGDELKSTEFIPGISKSWIGMHGLLKRPSRSLRSLREHLLARFCPGIRRGHWCRKAGCTHGGAAGIGIPRKDDAPYLRFLAQIARGNR